MTTPSHNRTVTPLRGVGPGTRLNDIYEIESWLATGGMGEVYRGRAIETGDPVAIKMIKASLTADEMVLALFRKEAAALHRIRHEAIVHYYVFTTDPDIRATYMAMEFVEGEALSEIIRRGPVSVDTVMMLVKRLASGLAAAHRNGVTHRDLSPDNIVLPHGEPANAKIIDFGIAKSPHGGSTVIRSQFAGKMNFASPEQVGLFGGEVTPASDVYSLALTLAAALTGGPIDMGGTQFDIVRKRQEVPDLASLDPRIRPLLARMLAPDPVDRPGMEDVASWSLPQRTIAAPSPASRPPGPDPRPPKGKGRGLVVAGISALVLAAGAGGAGWWMLRDEARRPRPTAELARPPQPAPPPVAAEPPGGQPAAGQPAPGQPAAGQPAAGQPAADRPASGSAGGNLVLPPPPQPPVGENPPPPPAGDPGPRVGGGAEPPVNQPVVEAPRDNPGPTPGPAAGAGVHPVLPLPPANVAESLPDGVFRDCAACPQMVRIAGGSFQMGRNGDPSERPVHRVTVDAFALGRYPVTLAEWRACVDARACTYAPPGEPTRPVHNLSVNDAQEYLAWLGKTTGKTYRLPTEAEWEYAARGGTTTRYWWGEAFRPELSNCRRCEGGTAAEPPAVGRLKPNPFGLFDMTGLVSQWTADCWHKDYRGAPTDGSAWTMPRCRERVLRGGSWQGEPNDLGVTTREFYDGDIRYPGHALRVARDP